MKTKELPGIFTVVFLCLQWLTTNAFSGYPISSAVSLAPKLNGLNEGASFNWELEGGQLVELQVKENFGNDEAIAVSGIAAGYSNSRFLFRGHAGDLYGWVFLEAHKPGSRYITNKEGIVEASPVAYSRIFPVCNLGFKRHPHQDLKKPQAKAGIFASHPDVPEPHLVPYDGQDLYKLQSLPGTEKVHLLDISRIMDGDTPIEITSEHLYELWQSISAFFSPFEINITTDSLVYHEAGVGNHGRSVMLPWHESFGSMGPVGQWGSNTYYAKHRPEQDTRKYDLRVANHELGHSVGLLHDGGIPGWPSEPLNGTPVGEYFGGIPEFKWVPIMGDYTFADPWGEDALYQFSLGEYETATNQQKDFETINKLIPNKKDDIPGTLELNIEEATGEVSPLTNRGRIDIGGDTDQFTFTVGESGASLDLTIDRTEPHAGTFLDVHALLHDSKGKLIAEHNPKAIRWAQLKTDLEPGQYVLTVAGGAEGTPVDGFTSYSSIGYYAIGGTITGGPALSLDDSEMSQGSFKINMYPSGSSLTFEIANRTLPLSLKLYNTRGKRVYQNTQTTSKYLLPRLPSGIYMLEVKANYNVHRQTIYIP